MPVDARGRHQPRVGLHLYAVRAYTLASRNAQLLLSTTEMNVNETFMLHLIAFQARPEAGYPSVWPSFPL